LYKIKDESEYRVTISRADELLEMEPEFESDEGIELGGLLDSIEEYEARTRPRLIGWLCASCNRSYSPTVESCSACVRAVCAPHPEQINQQHYNDHLDHMIQCDANFKGRGC